MLVDSVTQFLAGDGGLWALCISAFLSSTILPGSSEALLTAALFSQPQPSHVVTLVAAASLFNTLGSMTSWAIGRYFPYRVPDNQALKRIQKWGAAALFFAWVPVVGDMLPLAAGWLQIKFLPALLWTATGKTMRYCLMTLFVLGVL